MRYRWLLPIVQCGIDLFLAVALFYHVRAAVSHSKHPVARVRILALQAQESTSIPFDPKYIDAPVPPEFGMIVLGTLPAGILSTMLFPDARWPAYARWVDPRWLSFHELVSFSFWILIGVLIDRKITVALSWARTLIAIRAGAFLTLPWLPQLGLVALSVFWIGATARILYAAFVTAVARIRFRSVN